MSTEPTSDKPKVITLQPIGGGLQPIGGASAQTPPETQTTNITPPASAGPTPLYQPGPPPASGSGYQPRVPYPSSGASQSGAAYQPALPPPAPTITEIESQAHPLRIFVGIGAALVVGLLCAWLYAKFQLITGFGHSVITGGIGWIVGAAILIGAGRGGILPALCGGTVAFIVLFFSRFWLLSDFLGQEFRGQSLPLNSETMGLTFQSFTTNPMGFIVLLVGVAGGFIVPFRGEGSDVDNNE